MIFAEVRHRLVHNDPLWALSVQVESDERVIAPGAVDDFLIGSSADPEILNVFRGVAERRQHGCEPGGHRLVEKEPHPYAAIAVSNCSTRST